MTLLRSFLPLCAVLLPTLAAAQDFDAANKSLAEKSFSRACDGFSAYLKVNPGAREALAKRADACARVGKGNVQDLRAIADGKEADFAKAYALGVLLERGERSFEQARPTLEAQASQGGRTGAEARALLIAAALFEAERNSWDLKRMDRAYDVLVKQEASAEQLGRARYLRGVARVNQGGAEAQAGEKELLALGEGNTSWADDALFFLGQRRENEQKYVDALGFYDKVVQRFSPTTSNVRGSAEGQAATIRRPTLSLSASWNDLPGVPPQLSLSWRNVKAASFTLTRIDPLQLQGSYPDDAADFLRSQGAEKLRRWDTALEVPSRHAHGNKALDVEVKEPGLYVVTAQSDSLTVHEWLLVTQAALLTKTDRQQLLVFVTDVETGQALPGAEVVAFPYSGSFATQRGTADATGLVRFALPEQAASDSYVVFAKAGPHVALGRAGNAYRSSWSREQLAYAMTDRPLYKPGETVGLKLFLRTREGGPSEPLAKRAVTLRVTDPQGKNVVDLNVVTNEFGSATHTLPLPKNAPLGQYRVWVYSNEQSYQQRQATFQVEEYKPPEYSVTVEPTVEPALGEPLSFKVTAKYFSGGAVANAQGRAVVTVSPWSHSFGPWPDLKTDQDEQPSAYGYGDWDDERPYRRGGGRWGGYGPLASHTLVFKTAADGTALVQVPAVPGADGYAGLQYTVNVFVTDASRREITGQGAVKVAKAPSFVDVRSEHVLYRPGERVTLKLRAEDANGRPKDPEVLVRLLRIDSTGGGGKIAEARTKLKGGTGAVVLDADALGQVRAVVVNPEKDQEVLAQTELWLTNDVKPLAPPQPGFQLYVDSAPLKAGEAARVLVATDRPGGHVWVSVESDVVHLSRVVELVGRAKFVELPLTAAMAPNAMVMVLRTEDTQLRQLQRPLRVAGSEVDLGVSVAFDRATSEPGGTVPLTVKTTKGPAGQATEVAVTVVDEALYAIAPEAADFTRFFGRLPRQHVVRTMGSFSWRGYRQRPKPVAKAPVAGLDELQRQRAGDKEKDAPGRGIALGAVAPAPPAPSAAPAEERSKSELAEAEAPAARREAKKSVSGDRLSADDEADGAPSLGDVKARTDFGSSAGWWPALSGKTGAALGQPVKLTDSLTSWRATATVLTAGAHLGQGKASLRTAKALMVRLQAPRFFVEGDEVVLSAVIESHLAKATDVDVELSAPGFAALTPQRKKLTVAPDTTVRFDARVKVVELGDRTLRAVVKGGGASDAMEWTLPAFVHGSAQRQSFAGRLQDKSGFEFELPAKRKAALTQLELTLTPSVLGAMLDGLPYLAQYPYGCVEQTLSRFVPATMARKLVKDLNLPPSRVPANLDDMVLKGLERLYGFQHGDGGWGWWQTDSTNLWMTAYVVYALSLAKGAGVAVDEGALSRGRSYLTGNLGRGLNEPETHAFMTFALAKTGGAPKAAVDQLFERRTKLSPKGRALVALTLLAQKDGRARIAVENLDDVVKAAQARADAAVGEANDPWSTSAAIEATAFTLMAMVQYDLKSPNVAALTDFLVLRRNGGKWRTTRDTAFAVYALAELAKQEKAHGAAGSFEVLVNGKSVKTLRYAKGGVDAPLVLRLADKDLVAGKNVVQLRRDGAGTGYFAATVDVFNMNDFIKGVGGDVKVKRTYTLLGRPSAEKAQAPTEYGMPVESGVRVRVDLELSANKAVEYVMVEDLKPAGFEAVELRSGPQVCNYACAHAELRTDRVALFVSALPVGTTKLSYELRAEVPGKFAALPARLEAMYAPELQATADEMRFEVRDAPEASVVGR